MHDTPLITLLVAGFGIAFVLGAVAQRLRVSPIVGYLLAGVIVGPFTPGLVADAPLAAELAEVGVILLMFGVGLHFSVADLLSVRKIAIPGAVAQIGIATILGLFLGLILGWTVPEGLVFGLALSVASTVVLLRALQERHLLESEQGRIAVGWLIVEDLAMVLALVIIPSLAGIDDATGSGGGILLTLAITVGKVAAFVAVMLVAGRRVIPWILHYVAHTGSRELFRLAVLACALGIAFGAAKLFGVSFALGAFFAGMILSESALSQRAAEESLPLRDAFAVLFFVSVGMLFNPAIIISNPLAVIATLLIILFGKSIAAYLIVRLFGHSKRVALTISASLAQVGEFSFILAGLGVALNLLPEEGRDLVLTGAIVSMLVNPFFFDLIGRWRGIAQTAPAAGAMPGADAEPPPAGLTPTTLTGHAVIVGYGRVGRLVGEKLAEAGVPLVVVEDNQKIAEELIEQGIEAIAGNGVLDEIVAAANIAEAKWLLVAIPEAFEASHIVRHSRSVNPGLAIIARAHFDAEVTHLFSEGASVVIMGEREIAKGMVAAVLNEESGPTGGPGPVQ